MHSCRLDYPFLQTAFAKINVFPPLLPITTFAVESLFLNGGRVDNGRQAGAANPLIARAGCGNDFRIGGFYEGLAAASPIISRSSSPETTPVTLRRVAISWWRSRYSSSSFRAMASAARRRVFPAGVSDLDTGFRR